MLSKIILIYILYWIIIPVQTWQPFYKDISASQPNSAACIALKWSWDYRNYIESVYFTGNIFYFYFLLFRNLFIHNQHIRDLKPENVLIAADGHIILTDFGLSKMFEHSGEKYEHRTQTFCGTPDYLAPEVIEGQEYSYAADFWSLGTMLYEMITGRTPFHAQTVDEMYERVLYDELLFPPKMDKEAMDLIAGLLVKEPIDRLGVGYGGVFELRTHAYFDGHLNWRDVYAKKIEPMYIPYRESETDLSHFDTDFLNMSTDLFEENSFDSYRVDQEHYPAGLAENAFRGFSYYMKEAPEGLPYPSEISFTNDDFMMYDEEMEYDDGQSFYRKYSFSDDGDEQFGVFQHFSRSVDSDDITSRPSSVYLKNNLRDLSMEPVSHQNLNIRNSFIETSAKENVAMLRS
jgi:serine/threonine protein kinase